MKIRNDLTTLLNVSLLCLTILVCFHCQSSSADEAKEPEHDEKAIAERAAECDRCRAADAPYKWLSQCCDKSAPGGPCTGCGCHLTHFLTPVLFGIVPPAPQWASFVGTGRVIVDQSFIPATIFHYDQDAVTKVLLDLDTDQEKSSETNLYITDAGVFRTVGDECCACSLGSPLGSGVFDNAENMGKMVIRNVTYEVWERDSTQALVNDRDGRPHAFALRDGVHVIIDEHTLRSVEAGMKLQLSQKCDTDQLCPAGTQWCRPNAVSAADTGEVDNKDEL